MFFGSGGILKGDTSPSSSRSASPAAEANASPGPTDSDAASSPPPLEATKVRIDATLRGAWAVPMPSARRGQAPRVALSAACASLSMLPHMRRRPRSRGVGRMRGNRQAIPIKYATVPLDPVVQAHLVFPPLGSTHLTVPSCRPCGISGATGPADVCASTGVATPAADARPPCPAVPRCCITSLRAGARQRHSCLFLPQPILPRCRIAICSAEKTAARWAAAPDQRPEIELQWRRGRSWQD